MKIAAAYITVALSLITLISPTVTGLRDADKYFTIPGFLSSSIPTEEGMIDSSYFYYIVGKCFK